MVARRQAQFLRMQVAGTLLAVFAAPLAAQVLHGMDVLAGIAQSTGSCPKNPSEAQPSAQTSAPARSSPAGPACLVDLSKYLKSNADAVLIDTRLPAEFDRGHAAGAINVSPAELLSKPYWRKQTLLLLGKGKAEPELVDLCYAMRESGYRKVVIADGGVISWARQGLPWAGMALDLEQAMVLTPEEFMLEMQDPRQQLYVSPEMAELLKRFPDAAPLSAAAPTVASGTKRPGRQGAAPAGAAAETPRFILASSREAAPERIRLLSAAAGARMGFIYSDGEQGLAVHAKQTTYLDKLQRLGPKRLGCGL